jgi:SNW domain-containing protein 1
VKAAEFIKYTPNPNAPGFNPAAKQRVVRLVEAQVDPMEPPKHKHKKVPRGPPEDPVPVLHSPPRKVSNRVYIYIFKTKQIS